MILSDKVAGIIKDLTVKTEVQQIALDSAMRRIEELNKEVEELVVEVAELQERLREG
jgi:hypothetical protein